MLKLPVEECVARFCDAVAVMPEATWFDVSPSHDAYDQVTCYYHLGVRRRRAIGW